jgi:hypothetical protein
MASFSFSFGLKQMTCVCACTCDFQKVLLNFLGLNLPDLKQGRDTILEAVCSVLRDKF